MCAAHSHTAPFLSVLTLPTSIHVPQVRKKHLCVKVIKIRNIPKKEREATKLEVDLLRYYTPAHTHTHTALRTRAKCKVQSAKCKVLIFH
jgi:hypothetical protein